jgi:hypothetical protein
MELLRDNSEYFSVNAHGFSKYKNKFEWIVQVISLDEQFKFNSTNNSLCEALESAWTRLEHYNAYAAKNQH